MAAPRHRHMTREKAVNKKTTWFYFFNQKEVGNRTRPRALVQNRHTRGVTEFQVRVNVGDLAFKLRSTSTRTKT